MILAAASSAVKPEHLENPGVLTKILMYIHPRSLTASLPLKHGAWKTIAFPIGAFFGNFSGANSPKLPVRSLQVAERIVFQPSMASGAFAVSFKEGIYILAIVWSYDWLDDTNHLMGHSSYQKYPYRTPPLLIGQSNTNSKNLQSP